MKLEELFVEYPFLDDLELQKVVSRKKEFSDLRSSAFEETPTERAAGYSHQNFLVRYLMTYDDLLIYNEPGTGKSCIVPFLAELLKEKNPSRARKVYIITKKSLKDELMYQIVCPCTKGQYEPDPSVKEAQMKKNIKTKLKDTYVIMSYDEFATFFNNEFYIIKKGKEPELDMSKIQREFLGCIIWVDEIHTLRQDDKFKRGVDCGYFDVSSDVSGDISTETEGTTETTTVTTKKKGRIDDSELDKKGKKRVYCALWNLFHTAKKIKRILTTGTPLINKPTELGPIMNLLNPVSLQFPDASSMPVEKWNSMTLNDLAPYLNGKISYVRAKESLAKPVYLGEEILSSDADGVGNVAQKYETKVWVTIMSELQEKVYLQNIDYTQGEYEDFGVKSKQIADIVFPDGTFGSAGFSKHIHKSGKWYTMSDEFREYSKNIDNVSLMSSKFADISKRLVGGRFTESVTEGITESVTELSDSGESLIVTRKPDPGIFFISTLYVEIVTITFGLILENLGLARYDGLESAFKSVYENTSRSFCSTKGSEKSRTVVLDRRPRFAILTGSTKSNEFINIKELLNSYENRHGDYLKALISSPVGKEGININNCLNIELVDSEWNVSSTFQAESRAIRTTSHDDLILEQRQDLIRRGLDPIKDAKEIIIKIRKHCAVTSEGESINVVLYQNSENKDRPNKELLRKMKQLSIDCQIHYSRNVRPSDVDYSSRCDYQKCQYKCFGDGEADFGLGFFDVSSDTYDIFFLEYIDSKIRAKIIDLFHENFSLSLQEIQENLIGEDPKYIIFSLYNMLKDKNGVKDRYGYQMYLFEYSGIFFLNPGYPSEQFKNERFSLLEYIEKINTILPKYTQAGITGLETEADVENLKEKMSTIPLKERISMVETALLNERNFKYLSGPPLNFLDTFVLDYYKFFWYEFNEPEEEIATSLSKSSSRGSKRKIIHKRFKTKDLEKDVSQGDPVFIHKMYALEKIEGGTKYNTMAQLSSGDVKLRILPIDSVDFRDVLKYELEIYDLLIQKDWKYKINKYEIFGILLGKEFKIIDHTSEKKGDPENQRTAARGRRCETYDLVILVDILWKLMPGRNPFPNSHSDMNKESIIRDLVKNSKYSSEDLHEFPDNKVYFYYDALKNKDKDKEKYCGLIRSRLEELNHEGEEGRLIRIL